MDSNIEANADKVLIMVPTVKAAAFLKTPNFTHQILAGDSLLQTCVRQK